MKEHHRHRWRNIQNTFSEKFFPFLTWILFLQSTRKVNLVHNWFSEVSCCPTPCFYINAFTTTSRCASNKQCIIKNIQEQQKLNSKHLQFCVYFQFLRKCQHFRKPAKHTLPSLRKKDSGATNATLQFSNLGIHCYHLENLKNKVANYPPPEPEFSDLGRGLADIARLSKHPADSNMQTGLRTTALW